MLNQLTASKTTNLIIGRVIAFFTLSDAIQTTMSHCASLIILESFKGRKCLHWCCRWLLVASWWPNEFCWELCTKLSYTGHLMYMYCIMSEIGLVFKLTTMYSTVHQFQNVCSSSKCMSKLMATKRWLWGYIPSASSPLPAPFSLLRHHRVWLDIFEWKCTINDD